MRTLIPIALVFALGCAHVASEEPAAAAAGRTAQCPVCVYHRDLGCVDVDLDTHPPSCEWGGRTWWFCSEGCRERFLEKPEKFAGR
jgi:YHS domain-containing protein